MGLLNFIVNTASAVVKVSLTPIAVVIDVGTKVITGQNPELTEGAVKSAGKDLQDAVDDILP